jgi:hypothetical protein
MKEIYSFSMTEKKDGQDEKIYRFIMKLPNRREKTEGEEEYAVWLSKYINKGILTKAGLLQHDETTGGVLSEKNIKFINKLYSELAKKTNEITENQLKDEPDQAKISELYSDVAQIKRDIIDFESFHNSIFDNTAEIKSRNKTIEWYAVNLSYYQEGEGQIKPLFSGETTEEKLDSLDAYDESSNPIFVEAINKLFVNWTYYYMGAASKPEDFAEIASGSEEEKEDAAPVG